MPIFHAVRLAEPLKIKSLQAPGYFALALRAIGQDLANLYPCDLVIEAQANGFAVRGHCPSARLGGTAAKAASASWGASLRNLFRPRTASPSPPPQDEIVEFSRVYDSQDIDRLDQLGARYRTGMNRIPDPRTLGESLRTIGRLIDANNCQLTLVKKYSDRLVIEYRDTDDQPQHEEMTNFELYKLQRNYYGNRGTFKLIDKWKGRET